MAEKRSPEEFRSFVRDLGIRAFDQLASRFAVASEAVARRANSISQLATDWTNMQPSEKEQFFDQMINAAQSVAGFERAEDEARGGAKKKAKSKKQDTAKSDPRKKTKKNPKSKI